MSVIFLKLAQDELEEATLYYEQQQEGLGEAFAQEVEEALENIQRLPRAWTRLSDEVRRCRLKRFPYGVVYTLRGDDIIIVAVMHLRRRPGYYFWLVSPDLAVVRVAQRVRMGGHDVPEATVRQRYQRSISNFFSLYRPVASSWHFFDNTLEGSPRLIAQGEDEQETIHDDPLWDQICKDHLK
jgi:toxin ParE2